MQLDGFELQVVQMVREQAVPAVLGMARIGACYAWLPYLSAGTVPSKLARSVIALVTVIGLWPVTTTGGTLPTDLFGLLMATGGEVLIGTALGLMVSLPFYVFHAFGAIVDNQRGASISAALDPISGIEATETSNLLQMFCVVVFLISGGLVQMLEVIHASYQLLPMGAPMLPDLEQAHRFMGVLLAAALRMALPVLLLLLVVELLLGVLSRFSQQMNAFSVSLAVKSWLAFLALLVYLMPTLAEQGPNLFNAHDGLELLQRTSR